MSNAPPHKSQLACPRCGGRETDVKDSRGVKEADYIHRRRLCLSCGFKFSTREMIIGTKEKIDERRSKIFNRLLPLLDHVTAVVAELHIENPDAA